ncbi:Ribonucleotide reductase of class II (coenzyme B12-dependent) [Leptospirillum ferriphilum]|uniref:Vitamin B12-dependent ribonucleotide reductase n=1 Tax=Leptospirillum ferriphilum TaxID=178606 RepID=A0A094WBE4_9BACT|nr:adenosylcobalamin-dependent ribonucleoside-diphosphate reductase [Leptospirillum ferriphilum]KGA93825.1 Ribonucleotide reductase of class II (coenzyme B12-dependent) [Leptospirillum ferriphilum]
MSLLSENAVKVLEKRYLAKDERGNPAETPDQMFRRIANAIADSNTQVSEREFLAEEYYRLMSSLDFLPNSPTIMNAGRPLGQLSACFVLPVGDSMPEIFDTVKATALIHQTGGGTGFSFSRLRPKGAVVRSTGGQASGPVSFMKVINASTDAIKQGGTRRGANMGILRIDHPDILEFIDCKMDLTQVTNFNISVAITDVFMKAVKEDGEYDLIAPHNGEVVGRLRARDVFDKIAHNAWANGEPGLFFIDTANRANPTPSRWTYEATNPCGEQVLGPYESCNLGSINLERHVRSSGEGTSEVDWEKLAHSVYLAVRFLDNVVDANRFPIPELAEVNQGTRRIGLGIMGFARMLMRLGISYDSESGLDTAEEIMSFIKQNAISASKELSGKFGVYPYFEGIGNSVRNSHLLTIAPTGTISMIADTSSGCEPEFSIIWYKNVMDGTHLPYTLDMFEEVARREGFWTEDLPSRIVDNHGSCRGLSEVPEKWQKVFATAHDIAPEWHVRMQAAFQKHIDAAVSKTINMPETATIEDVKNAYLLSYDLGCKGITVYRNGSRNNQVLNLGKSGEKATPVESSSNPLPLSWGERQLPPDSSDGYRCKVNGRSGKSYVHLYFNEDGRPLEIFVTPSPDHRERESAILFGRLGSLALQYGAPIEKVVGQFVKAHEEAGTIGSDPYSLAKAIGQILSRFKDGVVNDVMSCPSCSGRIAFIEGCLKCMGGGKDGAPCGFSKC